MSAPLPLLTPAGNAWPPLPRPDAERLWAAFLTLEDSQWLAPEEIEAQQVAQLRRLLAHCGQHVPHYRDLMQALAIAPEDIESLGDLRRFPVLSRATCQAEFPRLQAEQLPPGTRRVASLHTSGSSGMPLEAVQTDVVQFLWRALDLRDTVWCGMDVTLPLAIIRPTPPEHRAAAMEGLAFSSWAEHLALTLATGRCHVMDIHQDLDRQLEWLTRVQPAYVVSYPTNLDALARLAQAGGRRWPGLRMIYTYAETLTADISERIAAAFGVPVKTSYSCYEAGYVASPCPDGPDLHVHAENVIVEVVDADDQPCAPGERGRAVLTTLHNFAMPYVRYEIMDEVEAGVPCDCGRGLPTLGRVVGKQRPLMRLPDGRRKHSAALAVLLNTEISGIRQFQVVQRAPDHVVVRIAPGGEWTPAHLERIVRGVQAYFEAPVRVDVELADRLPRSAGGKVPDFVVECDTTDVR